MLENTHPDGGGLPGAYAAPSNTGQWYTLAITHRSYCHRSQALEHLPQSQAGVLRRLLVEK